MGYDLHITRATDWTESDSAPIPLDEWVAYVRADPEMHLDEQAEASGYAEMKTPDGKTIKWKSKGRAVWAASSFFGLRKDTAYFHHSEGQITVRGMDKNSIKKMCAIARTLMAHVQGDEGEIYT